MKKKIKDLTDSEIKKICEKHNCFHCDECPLLDCPHNHSWMKNYLQGVDVGDIEINMNKYR